MCFQRSGNEEVPGCEGIGDSGIDYCFERPSENYLYTAGDNGNPSVKFPLGKCQGDCDSNSDCAEGLVCFERSGTEEVPGCEGLAVSGKDYCYEPASLPFSYKGNNGSRSKMFPLCRCEGDCDDDSECDNGLLCFQRRRTEEVPGCEGVGDSGIDYCFRRPSDIYTYNAGDNGKPSVKYPLGKCKGDCDSDAECSDGLKCCQRRGTEEVPGCEGLGVSGKDYCYDPNPDTPAPTKRPSSTPSTTPSVIISSYSEPSALPSQTPSFVPTAVPSSKSSHVPSQNQSSGPTTRPSLRPSVGPSASPSSEPSASPTQHPAYSSAPSGFSVPSLLPSKPPSVSPS